VSSIVIAPANTGKDNNKRIAVTNTDHAKSGIRSRSIPNTRKFPKVLIKFTAPKSILHLQDVKKKLQNPLNLLHEQHY